MLRLPDYEGIERKVKERQRKHQKPAAKKWVEQALLNHLLHERLRSKRQDVHAECLDAAGIVVWQRGVTMMQLLLLFGQQG
jgi:hypothetical protein